MAKNFLIFGDSIVQGVIPGFTWADLLKNEILARDRGSRVFSLGIGNETTAGVRARFENEFAARQTWREPVVIFATGINDTTFSEKTGQTLLSPAKTAENISALAGSAKNLGARAFFVGLTSVGGKAEYSRDGVRFFYKESEVRAREKIIAEAARAEAAGFWPLGAIALDPSDHPDGIHPSTAHLVMFAEIRRAAEAAGLLD